MNKLKSHFRFNKQERSGIFFLLLIIVLLQIGYFFFTNFQKDAKNGSFVADTELQSQIDLLKKAALKKDTVKIYPFNPNFITDYKGYVLGMSAGEIDRLHAFRKQNKFANTPKEFQKVTQISDSLLDVISPYFKFPEWTKGNGKRAGNSGRQWSTTSKKSGGGEEISDRSKNDGANYGGPYKGPVKDLNTATADELRAVYGIGEKLSARIVKFRDRLGGFLVNEQLYDVYGLEPEVVERALERFNVLHPPEIQRININTASSEELATLIYLQKHIAERIVEYRNGNGSILSLNELKNIEGFPSEKISRIALYLSL